MQYKLNKNQLKKAKQNIQKLEEDKSIWKKELKNAIEAKKSAAKKYYKGLKMRIKHAENMIKQIEIKIDKFKKIVENKTIEILDKN